MTTKIMAAQRLIAALSERELIAYAESLWDYAKTVGSPLNPKFEAWFRNRGRMLHRLSDAELDQIWRAAVKMRS